MFGNSALQWGEETVAVPQKVFVLSALLRLAFDRRAPRTTLAAWMYEEAHQSGALANLRQLLLRIQSRQAELGAELLVITRAEVRLPRPATAPFCDLDRFMTLGVPKDASELAALGALYRGDLMENLAGCGETLSAHIAGHRARLRERFCDLTLAGARLVRGRAAEDALRHLLLGDPYREEAWRALIELAADGQGSASAAAIYDDMRARFAADLGTAPDERTAAFVAGLTRRASLAPYPAVPSAPASERPAEPVAASTIAAAAVPKVCLLMPPAGGAPPEAQHLAEALIEDVSLGLCRLRSLAVIAPHTAWQLSDAGVARDAYGIDYFGETSVRAFAGRTRLVAKLVRSGDRLTLWAQDYDLLAGAPAEHHRELSQSITLALADGVEQAELRRFEMLCDPGAYALYLRAREHMRVLDLPSTRRARRVFAESAALSPTFVPALNGLSRTLIVEWFLLARTEPDLLRQAQKIAQRAVEIDPFSGEALCEVATASLYLGGLDEAVEGLGRAERLAPHHADILAEHADALTHSSDLKPALQRILKAIELNPLPPDDYLWKAGGTLFMLEDYDGALAQLGRMKRRDPVNRLTAACLVMAGRPTEAAQFVAKALEDQPLFRIDDWIETIPLRSKDHVAHYAGALRKAGFH
ncbi:BTAD domain-containing putative transcriptional regulator [Aureimonas sp. Leaf427]|nr:BTAD domain-containing putative transcriptional regulator [Aureimonas sp. Leaf427]